MMPRKLQKAINFKPKLDFGQGYSCWKYLSEHNALVSSFKVFRELYESKKLRPIPFEEYLGGQVCDKVVSKNSPTLSLIGIMKEKK
jgi:hypothetical protein